MMNEFKIQLDNQQDAEYLFEQVYKKACSSVTTGTAKNSTACKAAVNQMMKNVWECLVQNTQINGCDWSRSSMNQGKKSIVSEFEPIDEGLNRKVDLLADSIEKTLLELTEIRREYPQKMMSMAKQKISSRKSMMQGILSSSDGDKKVVEDEKIEPHKNLNLPISLDKIFDVSSGVGDDPDSIIQVTSSYIQDLSNSLGKVTDKLDRAMMVLEDSMISKKITKSTNLGKRYHEEEEEESFTPIIKRLREQNPFSPINNNKTDLMEKSNKNKIEVESNKDIISVENLAINNSKITNNKPPIITNNNKTPSNNNKKSRLEISSKPSTPILSYKNSPSTNNNKTPSKRQGSSVATPRSLSMVKHLAQQQPISSSPLTTTLETKANTTQNTPNRSSPRLLKAPASVAALNHKTFYNNSNSTSVAASPLSSNSNQNANSNNHHLQTSPASRSSARKKATTATSRRSDHPLQRQI